MPAGIGLTLNLLFSQITERIGAVELLADFQLSGTAPQVRFVRYITSNGHVRMLATNLPTDKCPSGAFGGWYHLRWRIEESYKRLKHGYKLESVSGLPQQAVLIDVHAKALADNLSSLVRLGAVDEVQLAACWLATTTAPNQCGQWQLAASGKRFGKTWMACPLGKRARSDRKNPGEIAE